MRRFYEGWEYFRTVARRWHLTSRHQGKPAASGQPYSRRNRVELLEQRMLLSIGGPGLDQEVLTLLEDDGAYDLDQVASLVLLEDPDEDKLETRDFVDDSKDFVESDQGSGLTYVEAPDSAEVVCDYQLVEFDVATRTQKVWSVEDSLKVIEGLGMSLEGDFVQGFEGPGVEITTPDSLESGASLASGDDGATGDGKFVFPPDGRTRVSHSNVTTYPWRTYGRMWFTFPGETGSHSGSGTMIDEFFYITAGHCVHEGNGGDWADRVLFSAGQDNERLWEEESWDNSGGTSFRRSEYQYYGEAWGVQLFSWTGWTNSGNWDSDMGFVRIDRNLGDYTGWLGYGYNTSDSWYDSPYAYLYGYPGDLTPTEYDMWGDSGNARDYGITTYQLRTNTMDVWPGQSGSGLYYYYDPGGGYGRYVHGVTSHQTYIDSNGNGRWDPGEPMLYNAFTRMTSGKFNFIQDSINATAAPTDRADLVDYDRWFDTDFAYCLPSTVRAGDSVSLRAVARNNGTANAGSFTVRFRLSTDDTYDTGDYLIGDATVSSLSRFSWADALTTGTIPTSIPTGNYYLVWYVDALGTVTEYGVNHNRGAKTSSRVSVVNGPPTISGLPDRSLNEDTSLNNTIDLWAYTYDVETPDSGLTFSITGNTNPDCGVSIDANRYIDINPTPNWYGTSDVTIRARDPGGLSDTDVFRITVRSVNDTPQISRLPDRTLNEDGSLDNTIDLWVYASDVETSDSGLTFTISGNTNTNCGASIDSNRYIDINPTADWYGISDVTIRVQDPGGLWATDTFRITVVSVNDDPRIVGLPDKTLNEDGSLNNTTDLWAYASDVETPDSGLTFSITNNTNPACGVTIDSNRYIDINPAVNWYGISDVTVRVQDPGGLWDTDIFRITVVSVNDAPRIVGLPDKTLNEDTSLDNTTDLWAHASDVETPDSGLTFSITNNTNPACGVSIDSNRYIDINPAANWYGTSDVTVRVQDPGGLWDTDTFRITVVSVNDRPVINSLTDSPDPVTKPNSVTLTALGVGDPADPAGSVVSVSFYRETNATPGLQVPGDTLVGTDNTPGPWSTTFSTAPLAPGTYTYYAQATDNDGATSPGGNAAPSTSNTVVLGPTVEGRYIFYNNSAFDGMSDDHAIPPDKSPLFSGQTAKFENYTSYSKGINGIMVDILGAVSLTAADFEFKVGNDNNPVGWGAAPNPASMTVRAGQGVGGSERVVLIWADNDWTTPTPEPGAIAKQWLQVTVRTSTGLTAPDVFYFGNAVGEAGNSAVDALVTSQDEILARNNPHGPFNRALIDDDYDYNRDELVTAVDQIIARNNATGPFNSLRLIVTPKQGGVALGSQGTAVATLSWLGEVDGILANNRPSTKVRSVGHAVDQVLSQFLF